MQKIPLSLLCDLVGKIADVLDEHSIHLTIRQLVLIGIIWFRHEFAYEVLPGVIFFTPRGKPQISIHNDGNLQYEVNCLIEETLQKPR